MPVESEWRNYAHDLGNLIRSAAFQTKSDLDSLSADGPSSYESGRAFAYYEVLSLMQQQARAFGLSLADLSLEDVDPDRDLFRRPPDRRNGQPACVHRLLARSHGANLASFHRERQAMISYNLRVRGCPKQPRTDAATRKSALVLALLAARIATRATDLVASRDLLPSRTVAVIVVDVRIRRVG